MKLIEISISRACCQAEEVHTAQILCRAVAALTIHQRFHAGGKFSTLLIALMLRSLRQHLCCADMLKDCATEQELFWMTEEVYEEEEAAQTAEDPNAVINVQELAHDTGRCDPVPHRIYLSINVVLAGLGTVPDQGQLPMTAGTRNLHCALCHTGAA